jgi:hypothetical protein
VALIVAARNAPGDEAIPEATMAKARKARGAARKRATRKRGIRSAKLKGRKVSRAKAPRTKARKKGLAGALQAMADAVTEARSLRGRLTGPDTFEDR